MSALEKKIEDLDKRIDKLCTEVAVIKHICDDNSGDIQRIRDKYNHHIVSTLKGMKDDVKSDRERRKDYIIASMGGGFPALYVFLEFILPRLMGG